MKLENYGEDQNIAKEGNINYIDPENHYVVFFGFGRGIFFSVACLLSVWSIQIHALSKNPEEPLQRMLQ